MQNLTIGDIIEITKDNLGILDGRFMIIADVKILNGTKTFQMQTVEGENYLLKEHTFEFNPHITNEFEDVPESGSIHDRMHNSPQRPDEDYMDYRERMIHG